MNSTVQLIIQFFTSLRLTVVLLALSVVLVFFGTLDQVHYGIWKTQEMYFQSWFVVWHYPEQWKWSEYIGWFFLPMPAGYTLGAFLLVNLLAAHIYRFKLSWKKSGIFLVHLGLIILLVSELLTHLVTTESQMPIDVGTSRNYSIDFLDNELVFIDRTDPEVDTVHSIPVSLLYSHRWQQLPRPLRQIMHSIPLFRPDIWVDVPGTELSIRTVAFYENAAVGRQREGAPSRQSIADRGLAQSMGIVAHPMEPVYSEQETNTATAFIEVRHGHESLGIWLVSNVLDERFPPQMVEVGDREMEVALRFRRYYHPFEIELLEFTHARYPGTDIPHNFASEVRIHHNDPSRDRSGLIFMNNPLRYEGLTFYQASFANDDQTSVLQVVRNPGWTLPYVAVAMMFLGLVVQFGMHFIRFLRKRGRTKGATE